MHDFERYIINSIEDINRTLAEMLFDAPEGSDAEIKITRAMGEMEKLRLRVEKEA